MKKVYSVVAGCLLMFGMVGIGEVAQAAIYTGDVSAFSNSITGGSGLNTGITLKLGQAFTVFAATTDLWNAGALPRWSNANGLVGDLYATGTDDSGKAAGTKIGRLFPNYNKLGLSAPYGALVGEISGVYAFLGSNFDGKAWKEYSGHPCQDRFSSNLRWTRF